MRKLKGLLLPLLALLLLIDAVPKAATAQIVGTLPFTLQNGTIADANQVMSDLNTIVAAVNANAASAGANTNITALNGLTTPLVYTSGGTSNYIGGTSGGSANAQTIASPIPSGFTLVTGKSVTFVAGFTNNGPTQLNVASTGLTNVFKQTASGAVAMVGGEIVAGQVYTAIFDGTQYQIQGPSPQGVVLPGTIIDWAGVNAPSGYLRADGTLYLRTNFTALFNAIAFTVSATTTSGGTSVVVPNSAIFSGGWFVGGANVTCNSTITAVPDGTHITISNNAGASGATTLTIGPYPQGDCSTTFAVPNLVGRMTAMRDGVTNITAATCPNSASIGSLCGVQNSTLLATNLPPYTPSGSVSTSVVSATVSLNSAVNGGQNAFGTNSAVGGSGSMAGALGLTLSSSFTGTAQGGTSAAFTNLPPVALVDKYIKF